jgi:predicted nucleic acid-binding protein
MKPWAYFDTSVIVKIYVEEPGTQEARALTQTHQLLSSVILSIEAVSAFARRKALGELTAEAFTTVLQHFREDAQFFEWVELTPPVRQEAESILCQHSLRTLDAIHLASAATVKTQLELPALSFITGDRRQLLGAEALGLTAIFIGNSS